MHYDVNVISEHAKNMRKHILDMGRHAGNHAAHMGGALSAVDAVATLYFGVMNTVSKGLESPERDRFILSKGHSSLALYSALIEAGFASESIKDTFEDDYSSLLGHPVKNRELGIEFTNGSLGMGLSIGVGVAIACRKRNIDNKVYVMLGDGECNEGAVWEALMSAAHFGLTNLVVLIDCNEFQLSGSTDDVMSLGNMNQKLTAFGWDVSEIDGNDIEQLCDVLDKDKKHEKPHAVVMHTIKGKGFSFSEGDNAWHHAIVTQKAYDQGLSELGIEG